ncbi:hypothetical protein ACXGQW_02275 [Wenyingzhuangia sp. IMCC45533]
MKDTNEIKIIIKDNIHQIKTSEFVPNGGYPDLENIDINIYSYSIEHEIETFNLGISFLEREADFCDMFGHDVYHTIDKQLVISRTSTVLK